MNAMGGPGAAPSYEELRERCAAAGVDVPADDLPLLAAALANHESAIVRLREVYLPGPMPPGPFDASWL